MLNIRNATKEDIPTILRFIRELAEYEKLLDQVAADEEKINTALFVQKSASDIIIEYEGKPIGHAIFFYNYSTFTGIRGLFIEDIYIIPEMRSRGFGKAVFQTLAKRAIEDGCARMEWMCLSWNAPSIAFYKGLGGKMMEDWRLFRLDRQSLANLAKE